MTTSWLDDEYGRVATALLYPSSRRTVVVHGDFASSSSPIAYQLLGHIVELSEAAKAQALALADQINAAETRLLGQALGDCGSGGSDLAVTRVSDITLDPRQGIALTQRLIARARARLSALVDFPVNVASDLADGGGGGGINGNWRP
jgi:hypothetical protein